jgi:phosphoribosyl-ATP pyrophosphohydrolase/phosphoribosyl-AMP cyclohydrolase
MSGRTGDTVLRWEQGLLPVVVQDARSGVVLTLAWMNQEAFERTRKTGQAHFWSRSRQALWRKGETSGNTQRVTGVRADCDGDTIVLQVVPAGPACHTGRPSCFHRDPEGTDLAGLGPGSALSRLEATIAARRAAMPEESYTASLLRGGVEAIGAKVSEEAEEVVRAARGESDARVANEAADLFYHVLVLLAGRGIRLDDVLGVLAARGA